jgi:hypothetical protein
MDPDQTVGMRWPVWIHAQSQAHFVGFVMALHLFRMIGNDVADLTPTLLCTDFMPNLYTRLL